MTITSKDITIITTETDTLIATNWLRKANVTSIRSLISLIVRYICIKKCYFLINLMKNTSFIKCDTIFSYDTYGEYTSKYEIGENNC